MAEQFAVARFCSRGGFMLIELLIVLAIMGVLATLVVPVAQIEIQRRKEVELGRALRDIRRAIDDYKRASDEGRIAKKPGESGYPRDLEILVRGVPDLRDPKQKKIYFLRRIAKDPMQPEPGLDQALAWGKRSYDSEADDPQEGVDIFDVYSRSRAVGLNGIPYSRW